MIIANTCENCMLQMKTYGELLIFNDTLQKRLFFDLIDLRGTVLIQVAKQFESFQ